MGREDAVTLFLGVNGNQPRQSLFCWLTQADPSVARTTFGNPSSHVAMAKIVQCLELLR
jgi:hypothetical protein